MKRPSVEGLFQHPRLLTTMSNKCRIAPCLSGRPPHASASAFRISRDRTSSLGFLRHAAAQEKSRISAEDWLLQNSLRFALDRDRCSGCHRGYPRGVHHDSDAGRCCLAVWTRLGQISRGNGNCPFCRPGVHVIYNRGLEEAEQSTAYLSLSRSLEIVRIFPPSDPDGAVLVGASLHHRRFL